MQYICNKCKSYLCEDDEEVPSKCDSCGNGRYGGSIETQQIYSLKELVDMGRITRERMMELSG